jgi:hypothetical protein
VQSTVANPVLEMVTEYDPGLTDPDALFAVLRHAGLAPLIGSLCQYRHLLRRLKR